MIGLPISILITGDRAKAFDWISVTTVDIDLSIDAMTNFLNAIRIHCINCDGHPLSGPYRTAGSQIKVSCCCFF